MTKMKFDRESPIGVFDSGVGGISLLKKIRQEMSHENLIYYGDNVHAPYGDKLIAVIENYVTAGVNWLLEQKVKAIVFACNTVTAVMIEKLRHKYPNLILVGMEPEIKTAEKEVGDEGGRVLMMATTVTCNSRTYQTLRKGVDPTGEKIIDLSGGELAKMIENPLTTNEEIENYLRNLWSDYRSEKVKAIVLGCTHYSFVQPEIEKMAEEIWLEKPLILDGRQGTVQQLRKRLEKSNLLAVAEQDEKEGDMIFHTTGAEEKYLPLMIELLKEEK